MLIETAAVINNVSSFMIFNNVPPQKQRIYQDVTTWWAPTITCLKEMLRASLFEPIDETINVLDKAPSESKEHVISRVSLVAQAVAPENIDQRLYSELARTYRTPGFSIDLRK